MYGLNRKLHLHCNQNYVQKITHNEPGTRSEEVTCSAKVGKAHNHPATPKWVIELHLFRWACQLRFIQSSESPKKVIEALAPSWPQFSKFTKLFLDKIAQFLYDLKYCLRKSNKRQLVLNLFQKYCNEEQLNKFKQLLQSQQPYWPPSLHPTNSGKYCL